MNKYELTYLLPGSFSEDEVVKENEKIKKTLEGLKIISEKTLGRKRLAYAMKKGSLKEKSGFGYFLSLVFESQAEEIKRIDSEIKNQEAVLRYLIVEAIKEAERIKKVVEKEAKPVKAEDKGEKIKEEKKLKAKEEKPKKAVREKKEVVEIETKEIKKEVKPKKIIKKPEIVEEKIKELDEKLEEILKE